MKNNLKPEIEVLFETDIENWANDEIRTISEYKLKGYRLLNLAIGGNEPFCSKEVRQESGRKVAKLIHSDEKRKRLWYLKKELSAYISKLKKEGNIERYEHWITKIKNSKVNTYFNFNI